MSNRKSKQQPAPFKTDVPAGKAAVARQYHHLMDELQKGAADVDPLIDELHQLQRRALSLLVIEYAQQRADAYRKSKRSKA